MVLIFSISAGVTTGHLQWLKMVEKVARKFHILGKSLTSWCFLDAANSLSLNDTFPYDI